MMNSTVDNACLECRFSLLFIEFLTMLVARAS